MKRSKLYGLSKRIITLTSRRQGSILCGAVIAGLSPFMNNVDEEISQVTIQKKEVKMPCALDFGKNRMGRKQGKVSSVKNQNLHLILHVCNVSLTAYLALSHRCWQRSVESSIVHQTNTFAMTPQYDLEETKTMFKQIFQSLVSQGLCFDKEEVLVQEATSQYIYESEDLTFDNLSSTKESNTKEEFTGTILLDTSNVKEDEVDRLPVFDIDNHTQLRCMFDGICVDHDVRFHVENGGSYHLQSSLNPIELGSDKKCTLGVLITTMPYSGSYIQALAIKTVIEAVGGSFRYAGTILWNWHAHSKFETPGLWLETFGKWRSQLSHNDVVIIYAPYIDDANAIQLCRKSITISGHRSLAEITQELENLIIDSKQALRYSRSILHHFNKWQHLGVDITSRFDDLFGDVTNWNGITNFGFDFCESIELMLDVHCDRNLLVSKISANDLIRKEFINLSKRKIAGHEYVSRVDSDMNALVVRNTFEAWMKSMKYY